MKPCPVCGVQRGVQNGPFDVDAFADRMALTSGFDRAALKRALIDAATAGSRVATAITVTGWSLMRHTCALRLRRCKEVASEDSTT